MWKYCACWWWFILFYLRRWCSRGWDRSAGCFWTRLLRRGSQNGAAGSGLTIVWLTQDEVHWAWLAETDLKLNWVFVRVDRLSPLLFLVIVRADAAHLSTINLLLCSSRTDIMCWVIKKVIGRIEQRLIKNQQIIVAATLWWGRSGCEGFQGFYRTSKCPSRFAGTAPKALGFCAQILRPSLRLWTICDFLSKDRSKLHILYVSHSQTVFYFRV